ncbi:tRNA (guanine-N(1)-)-methyltransferase [Sphaerotilus natans subsp. natans DSM 6575]|uniref:tRNA (guanine-N(1)-)-methyltransferase n=1 Tax=Sphaerotilus natans subsp. natans DSM 6575 TaxID=1286631 RepID=A0A059KPN6_9BURK|nr:tRNA (guanosine(37)-N1)-methyltransferase TrmD [Sphaerotilus natans]KDB53335.1 tRNA (guanine-N(1)-)-methyltransferase [Sphaerotilus natans subsp. natans DSM 6575]SIQ00341.1 tRNA (Guanine37-N(1)-) methyltransferase [Sphaerotilus natans]
MRFDVLTLFPELFDPFMKVGVTRRAYATRQVDVRLWPLRDFADDNYRRVDDRPYGGGPGMVMLVEPLERALTAVRADRAEPEGARAPVILFSPAGAPLTQARVQRLAASPGAVLLCGRYEGIDQRFVDRHVDEEISLGDFVLSGGELPALTLLDAVTRLQPGVLHAVASHEQDSFSDGLLDCPHYSRPERLGDDAVPEVLMSGHHARIQRWRREQQLAITARRRPDLIEAARAAGRLSRADEQFLAQVPSKIEL